jgi:hypothetical protein
VILLNRQINKYTYGASITERLFDALEYEKNTHINLPHEEAVEDAKQWIDEHEV